MQVSGGIAPYVLKRCPGRLSTKGGKKVRLPLSFIVESYFTQVAARGIDWRIILKCIVCWGMVGRGLV
jgi:hypothetical protein